VTAGGLLGLSAGTLGEPDKWENSWRRYRGFITRDDRREEIYFHISRVEGDLEQVTSDRVSFVDEKRWDGRLCADKVIILDAAAQRRSA